MWTKIRTLGDLQILTRASYVMLIFVPLLAGMWPAVKSGINRYNNVVIESKVALESAADRFEFVASTLAKNEAGISEIKNIVESLERRIDAIIKDYSLKTIEHDSLPSVWAFSFLASLSVMLAHLLYQALAPPLVKRITILDYVNEALKNFVEHPSDGQLERAKEFASFSEEKYEKSIVHHKNDISVTKTTEEREKEEKRRQELGIIEKGALCVFRMNSATIPAGKRPPFRWEKGQHSDLIAAGIPAKKAIA